jgi:hypothetical protein
LALANSGWLGWTAISRPAGTASTKDGVSNREPDRKSGCPVGLIFLGGFAPLRDKFFSLAEAQRTQSKTRKLRFLIASWQTLAATAEETEQNGNRSFLSAFSAPLREIRFFLGFNAEGQACATGSATSPEICQTGCAARLKDSLFLARPRPDCQQEFPSQTAFSTRM